VEGNCREIARWFTRRRAKRRVQQVRSAGSVYGRTPKCGLALVDDLWRHARSGCALSRAGRRYSSRRNPRGVFRSETGRCLRSRAWHRPVRRRWHILAGSDRADSRDRRNTKPGLGLRMAGRGVPGPVPRTDKRVLFERLINAGVTNSEACRAVGVNRKTGTRWRLGRSVPLPDGRFREYAAVINYRPTVVSARYLSVDERVRIADLRNAGLTIAVIAQDLGRSPSTISRELRRNRQVDGAYRPHGAQQLATQRRRRPGRRRLGRDPVLRATVQNMLKKKWSPEQISHELRVLFPTEQGKWLTPESLYQAIYHAVLVRDRSALRSGRTRRRPHRRPDTRRPTGNRRSIDERPAAAADRSQPGNWEGDLIVGSNNRSAIGTLVERRSRFTILLHLSGKSAEAVTAALIDVFTALPPELRQTLTWDQGTELFGHAQVTAATGVPVFFCAKASPWQRPSNENANGLLRQYFPKGTDLRVHTAEHLAFVAAEINDRPRKTLGWSKPASLFVIPEAVPDVGSKDVVLQR